MAPKSAGVLRTPYSVLRPPYIGSLPVLQSQSPSTLLKPDTPSNNHYSDSVSVARHGPLGMRGIVDL